MAIFIICRPVLCAGKMWWAVRLQRVWRRTLGQRRGLGLKPRIGIVLSILNSCELNRSYFSFLAMIRGFKGTGNFVFGFLACKANTADAAESKENEDSKDNTNYGPNSQSS